MLGGRLGFCPPFLLFSNQTYHAKILNDYEINIDEVEINGSKSNSKIIQNLQSTQERSITELNEKSDFLRLYYIIICNDIK